MKTSKAAIILSILTGLLVLLQTTVGLFSQGGSGPFAFTTLHGNTIQMYGQGIYAYDTFFKAPILRGTDSVTLFIGLPLLVVAILLYRRGLLRGGLLLTGALAYLLYNAASVALGAAYNNLFLLYVACFSACLFALALTVGSIDLQALAARIRPGLPYRGIAIVMFVSGLALLAAWLGDILVALFSGGVPAIDSYTTEVTYVFDLGIITPLCVLTGVLLLRRAPISYLLSAAMLVVLSIIGLVLVMQTVFQVLDGIYLTVPEFIGKDGSFMLLALIALWFDVALFRRISE